MAQDSASGGSASGPKFEAMQKLAPRATDAETIRQEILEKLAYAIGKDAPVELLPLGGAAFTVPWRYPLVLDFSTPGRLVINPGHWAQTGLRQ